MVVGFVVASIKTMNYLTNDNYVCRFYGFDGTRMCLFQVGKLPVKHHTLFSFCYYRFN